MINVLSEEHKRRIVETRRKNNSYIPWNKGLTKETDERVNKYSIKKRGNNSYNWKGENITYSTLHGWIRIYKPKIKFCECCKKVPPYDLANISGDYKRDINDFEWLCRKCHMKKDGRLKMLAKYGEKGRNIRWKKLSHAKQEPHLNIASHMMNENQAYVAKKEPHKSRKPIQVSEPSAERKPTEVSEPYAQSKLGHTHISDWKEAVEINKLRLKVRVGKSKK